MNTHRLTDDEVAAVLSGRAPGRSSEAATVTRLVGDIHSAFVATTAPPPSPELAAHLDLEYLAEVSSRAHVAQWHTAQSPGTVTGGVEPSTATSPRPARIRRLVGWLSGLGLAWQVGLGSTAAFAAVTGAGVSGVLPDQVQDLFDKVVTQVTPFDRAAADIEDPWLVRRNATPTKEAQPFDAPQLKEAHAESVAGVKGRDGSAPDGERNAVGSNQPSLGGDDDASNSVEGSKETPDRYPSPQPTRHPGADDAEEDRLSDSRDAEEEAADHAEDEAGDAEDAAEEAADRAEDEAGDAEDATEEAADRAEAEDARGDAEDAAEEAAEEAADDDA